MRLISLYILAIFFSISIKGQNIEDLSYVSLYSNSIHIKVPKDFDLMRPEVIQLKYPQINPSSIFVYSNFDGKINVLCEKTSEFLDEKSLPSALESLKKTLNSVPSIDLKSVEILGVNDKKCIKAKFISQALDGSIYNIMYVTSFNNYKLVISFNVLNGISGDWVNIGNKIIDSIKIN